jgi:hypothetical protein
VAVVGLVAAASVLRIRQACLAEVVEAVEVA